MAITAYTGVMGSGKSYEAVDGPIVSALREGRRVVSNITGLDFDALSSFIGQRKDGKPVDPSQLLVVPSARVSEPGFFFDGDAPDLESVVKPGDLVVMDEVWQFWGDGAELSPEHRKFFRMHRHYVETLKGFTCDLVILIQDLGSLHRFVKGVLEFTFVFRKLKALGLASRYRVFVYEGKRLNKGTLVTSFTKKYDKRVFPLYKSYDGNGAKERNADDRVNLFKDWKFIGAALFGVVMLAGCGWYFFGMVGSMVGGAYGKDAAVASATAPASGVSAVVPPRQTLTGAPVGAASLPAPPSSPRAALLGFARVSGGRVRAWIREESGAIREVEFESGSLDGSRAFINVEGRRYVFAR